MERENKKIKIIHIIFGLQLGGLERVVINLVSKLNRDEFISKLYCLSSHKALGHELEQINVEVVYLNRRDKGIAPLLPFRLALSLRKEKPMIVHTHNFAGCLYGVSAAGMARVPVIIHTEHGTTFPEQLKRVITRQILFRNVDKVVTVCNELKEKFHNFEKIPEGKMVTIPNGIDSKKFFLQTDRRKLRKHLGFNDRDLLIGVVARLDPIKDHATLLKAMPLVINEIPNVKLLVVGDGEERETLEKLAQGLSISNHVYFLGEREDVPDILSILNLFVLPSKREGLSLSILEAMAAGLPVVVTDVGANSELVVDKKTGALVEPGDSQSLAHAIIGILSHLREADEMGKVGKMRFQQYFTLEKSVEAYKKLYISLLGEYRN